MFHVPPVCNKPVRYILQLCNKSFKFSTNFLIYTLSKYNSTHSHTHTHIGLITFDYLFMIIKDMFLYLSIYFFDKIYCNINLFFGSFLFELLVLFLVLNLLLKLKVLSTLGFW